MSREYYREIAQKIKSGEYFEDAKEWYQIMYIYPVIERSFFLLLTIVSLAIACVALIIMNDFFPLSKEVPIVIGMEDQVNNRSTIRRMTRSKTREHNSNLVVQKFLLSAFVAAYESYNYEDDFKQLTKNRQLVESFVTSQMLESYNFYTSVRNPDGPTLKYKDHTKMEVEVWNGGYFVGSNKPRPDTIVIHDNGSEFSTYTTKDKRDIKILVHYRTAFLDFFGYETNKYGKTYKKWKAVVDYRYSDVTFDREEKEFLPIDFTVTSYKSKIIPEAKGSNEKVKEDSAIDKKEETKEESETKVQK